MRSRSRMAAHWRAELVARRTPEARARRAPGHRGAAAAHAGAARTGIRHATGGRAPRLSRQVGYADLVRQLLGGSCEGPCTDGLGRRPLSRDQLAYAADDVRYLPALAAALEERLAAAGRRALAGRGVGGTPRIALYRVEPEEAWRRLKGLERLDTRGVCGSARARRMARAARDGARPAARLDAARRRDPRACSGAAATRDALARLAEVPPGTATRPLTNCSRPSRRPWKAPRKGREGAGRPGPEQLRIQKLLQMKLSEIAAELVIQPEVLATRRELVALARGERSAGDQRMAEGSGWRALVAVI